MTSQLHSNSTLAPNEDQRELTTTALITSQERDDNDRDYTTAIHQQGQASTSKPLKCPPPKRVYLQEEPTSEEDERLLEQIYDQSTWNMFYLITNARSKRTNITMTKGRSHDVAGNTQGPRSQVTSTYGFSANTTPKLVACTDQSDDEDEGDGAIYDTMPFHLDDF